jgi:hypothetical protein
MACGIQSTESGSHAADQLTAIVLDNPAVLPVVVQSLLDLGCPAPLLPLPLLPARLYTARLCQP